MRKWYGLDCETYDPLLKTAGWSWKYGKGELLCTSIYYPETEEKVFIQKTQNKKLIYALVQDKEVSFIGANIIYDLGWLLYAYGIPLQDVKCSFIDVLIAESSLDEYANPSLDSLSKKYLGKGKNSYQIEKWIAENVEGAKGDFRKYLRYAPIELLKEYVESDAEYPYFIWLKQLPLLVQEHLTKRVKLDFDCIKPSLMFTINGFPIDVEQKKKNLALLTEARDSVKNEFLRKYQTNLLVNSPKQLASFLETQHIPYRVKIMLKGKNGRTFSDYKEMDNEMHNAKKLVSSFRFEKRIPVAYITDSLAERTKKLLEDDGFMVTVNPNIDKKFLKAQRDNYPVLGLIQDWKDANSILSKFLSEDFDRFITDVDGVYKGRPQFNIAKAIDAGTISSRFSSQNFNCQQIPSKGSLTLNDTTYDFAKMTRGLFKPIKGHVLFKIDYSQVEYRLIVSIAVGQGAEEAREAFRKDKGTDFHQYVMDLTGLTRKYAKNMNFGTCCSIDSLFATDAGWSFGETVVSNSVVDSKGILQNSFTTVFEDDGLCFELTNGVILTTTNNHLFLDCSKVAFGELKQAKDMKIGDRIPINKNLQNKSNKLQFIQKYELDESLAYLLGLYIGDGYCSARGVEILAHNKNAHFVQSIVKRFGCYTNSKHGEYLHKFHLRKEYISLFNSCGKRAINKKIPKEIYTSPENVQISFLAGLLDSDGSVQEYDVRYVSINEELVRQIALLCSLLGFDCFFNAYQRKDNKPTEYLLLIYSSNNKEIPTKYRDVSRIKKITSVRGWNIVENELKEKYFRKGLYKENVKLYDYLRRHGYKKCDNSWLPKDCWQKDYIPTEIRSIKKAGKTTFLGLETETHYYNVNGLLTHNSFGMGVKSMAENFGWTLEHANEISEQYHEHLPFVLPTLQMVGDIAKQRGYIKTICGNKARLKNKNFAYTMLNRYTQGSGADIMKSALVEFYNRELYKYVTLHTTVHDELDGSVLPCNIDKVIELEDIMENTVKLNIPLSAEAEFGMNWADVRSPTEWLEAEDFDKQPKVLKEAVKKYIQLKGQHK